MPLIRDRTTVLSIKRANFDRYVVREYLAYRLFHALTSISCDVRLLHITYADTDTGRSIDIVVVSEPAFHLGR